MDFKKLVPVEWSNQRVLTTAQLAEFYECEVRHISDNFKRNESRFVEGKHYFKLEGESLKQFKNCSAFSGLVGLRTPALYLWTARGAARHAKMLSTEKAWEVFEELEDNYFNRNISVVSKTAKKSKAKKRRSAQNLFACVYALLLSNGIVKIGYSAYPRSRAAKIESETKLNITQVHFSLFMPREDARLVEWACQKNFSSRRVQGEFFSVTFEEACAEIDSFTKVLIESRLFKSECGGKIFKVAKKNIVESAKLIVGKKS